MTEPSHETIVIGAGQAGPALANTLYQRGEKVALIEARLLGGTCLNDGCRPTKALRASAKVAYAAGPPPPTTASPSAMYTSTSPRWSLARTR